MDNYKIIKKLGYGMIGTVYLVKKDNVKYALKIEHILEKDVKKNLRASIWREIDFCMRFGNKHPEQFIELIEYDVIDECDHTQKYAFDLKNFPPKMIKEITALNESNYCVRRIYTLVDTSLNKIYYKLKINNFYSMMVQLSYTIYLMHKAKYIHGDLHSGNIGLIKTNKKNIKILDYSVPTFGWIFKAIDYGLVKHVKYLKSKEKKEYKFHMENEQQNLIYLLVETKFWNFVRKNKIKLDYKKDVAAFKKMDEYNIIKDLTDNENLQMLLFEILYPEKHQRLLLGNKFKKVYKINLSIPIEDIIFTIRSGSNSLKVIDYFMSKL